MKVVGRVGALRMCAALAAVVLAMTGLVSRPVAAQVGGPEDCPEVRPIAEIERGLTGTGYTVSQGTEPEPFDVEVLGVLENGVAPGRDMIVVDTSGPAIDAAGGIWFGMSGSPVYDDDGALLGAVAFGLTWGPSSIGGLTPAADLVELLDYPSGQAPVAATSVALSGGLERRVNAREGGGSDDVSLRRLRAPLSVSGLTERGRETLAKAIRKEGNNYLVTQGSSATAAEPGAELGTVGAGDTFAAALSYGDITIGGIGTTSLVCDGQSVAFGHPFGWEGKTELGANAGDTHTIVDDPLFGPYKLASITEPVGIVDQDRLAGIRALLGTAPELRPVTSTVTATDIGRTQDGASQAVTDDIVPILGFYHLFGNIDSTFDTIGEGNSRVAWTVTGTTEEGEPWSLSRSNLYSSRWDISIESSIEVLNQLGTLVDNKFTEIDFTGVDLDATVEEERSGYRIGKVRHSNNNRNFKGGRHVKVRRGSTLFLRIALKDIEGDDDLSVDMKMKMPRDFRRGYLLVSGGNRGGGFFCFGDFGGCSSGAGKVSSFDELIDSLEDAPKGNDLTVTLDSRRGKELRSKTTRMDRVVNGSRFLSVVTKKGGGGGVTVSPDH